MTPDISKSEGENRKPLQFSGQYVKVYHGDAKVSLKRAQHDPISVSLGSCILRAAQGPTCLSACQGQTLPKSRWWCQCWIPLENPTCPVDGFVYRKRNSDKIPGKYNMEKNVWNHIFTLGKVVTGGVSLGKGSHALGAISSCFVSSTAWGLDAALAVICLHSKFYFCNDSFKPLWTALC